MNKKGKLKRSGPTLAEDKDFIPLLEAVETVCKTRPWLSSFALRRVVASGVVPSRRSGPGSRAHYFVRLADLSAYADREGGAA